MTAAINGAPASNTRLSVVRSTADRIAEIMASDRVTADLDAEAAVLSAVILDPAALPRVIDFLQSEHFCSEAHRQIFKAATELFSAKEPIDAQTVASHLRARNRLAQVGGIPGIASILDSAPVVRNVRAYGVYVHDMWRRRQVILACQRFALRAMEDSPSVQGFIDGIVADFGKLGNQNPSKPIESLEATLTRLVQRAMNPPDPKAAPDPLAVPMRGFPIGLPGVDRLLGGLRVAAKTTIVALTGVGKTAFMLQAAASLAKQEVGVLLFSTEITREECGYRLLAQESGVPARKIQSGELTPGQRNAVLAAEKVLAQLPLVIDETAKLSIEQVAAITKAEAEKMLYTHRVRLGLVGFDYAQRSEASRSKTQKDRHEQIGHFSKGFKQLMQELKLAGLELAQAKPRKPGTKKSRPNANTDIAGSGEIAKEADEVIFLEAENEPTEYDPRVEITAWIGKNRAGPKAKDGVSLEYRGDLYRFRDINAPNTHSDPSRQYVDTSPEPAEKPPIVIEDAREVPEPPRGFFDDFDHDTNPLTEGL